MLRIFQFCLCFILVSCSILTDNKTRINGVSYVAAQDTLKYHHIKPVLNVNANYVAIMPFGFIRDIAHPEIKFDSDQQWFGETKAGVTQYISILRKHDLKIMLKPQIWVWHGEYTGYIKMDKEEDWLLLEKTYSNFILEFAEVAEKNGVEIFCIGTELDYFIKNRPQFWIGLIRAIRNIYKGKLTYASNWDEYKRTSFWNDLDYIGIDAYFPVSDSRTPTVDACKIGWEAHKHEIKHYADSLKLPVLFTEYGYRSMDFAAKEPWKSDRSMTAVNLNAQANATQALYETFWDEPWFAGGFVWKWFHNHYEVGGETNSQFTPQNKPVESIISSNYSRTN